MIYVKHTWLVVRYESYDDSQTYNTVYLSLLAHSIHVHFGESMMHKSPKLETSNLCTCIGREGMTGTFLSFPSIQNLKFSFEIPT